MTLRRCAAAVSSVALAGLVTLGGLAAPRAGAATAHPSAVRTQASEGSVSATITDVGPPLTRDPSSVLRVRATIVNDSTEPVTRVRWRLRVAAPVTTRAGLTTKFDDRGDSEVLWHDDLQVIDVLPGLSHHDVALYLPLDVLEQFPQPLGPAILPLRFEVTHRLETTIATADTFVVWFPEPQPTLRLGWVVAITDPPARDASFAIRGDDLEKSVSAGGRLDTVLTVLDRGEQLAGGPLPLTLAIDAQLVESVRLLAEGSRRVEADGRVTQRIGSPAAAAWLQRLRQRAARHPVIALPYADADLVALVRADLSAQVTASLARGRDGTGGIDTLLGIHSLPNVAWPVGSVIDSATTDVLANNGISTLLLDRQSVRKTVERYYTTTAASDLDASARPVTAIVPDAPVTSLAYDVAAGGDTFAVARQRLLAETAAIWQQRPSDPRDVFVSFPRDWLPTDLEATASLLALPLTTPWLTGTTIPETVARPERAGDRATVPRYPESARLAELPGDALRASNAQRSALTSFRTILADGDNPGPGANSDDRAKARQSADAIRNTLDAARDAVDWSDSAHWRADRADGAALTSAVARILDTLRGQVSVNTNTVRLTRTRGPVPITVVNHFGTPVRVRIKLHSQRFGLTFGSVHDVTVAAAQSEQQPGSASVQVPFEAQTVGKFPVDAQLFTADNIPLGAPARITVSTTAYGRLALAVTISAFILLVLASVIRFVFRRRRGGHGRGSAGEPALPLDGGQPPTAESADSAESPQSLTSAGP
jgi:hypothetical protein